MRGEGACTLKMSRLVLATMDEQTAHRLGPSIIKLVDYMEKHGGHDGRGRFPNWYVGQTEDPERRRSEHNNPAKWFSVKMPNARLAKQLKSLVYETLTLKSENHGAIKESVHVYVFKMTKQTKPPLSEVT